MYKVRRPAPDEIDNTESYYWDNADIQPWAIKIMEFQMQKNQQKVISLFTSWDADGNGSVSRGEFGMALEMLGLDAPREAVAALFDEFDADGSGTIEMSEYIKYALRDAHDPRTHTHLAQSPSSAGATTRRVIMQRAAVSRRMR